MRNTKSSQRGFTLIELMITVAIVGILAAIAYPSYSSYVLRGYRSEGISMLTDAVARMERYYAQNNSYAAADPGVLGFTNGDATNKTKVYYSASKRYQLTMASAATTYTFTVTPIAPQDKDPCKVLTIDQAGTKASSGTATNCFK